MDGSCGRPKMWTYDTLSPFKPLKEYNYSYIIWKPVQIHALIESKKYISPEKSKSNHHWSKRSEAFNTVYL